MYTTHFLIKGSLTRNASCQALAPSILAASITSSEMLLSAPLITTIQPPAPVQNAIRAKTAGRCPGAIVWPKDENPKEESTKLKGLTPGSSMKSQTRTLAAPASAPGM